MSFSNKAVSWVFVINNDNLYLDFNHGAFPTEHYLGCYLNTYSYLIVHYFFMWFLCSPEYGDKFSSEENKLD